ncbi:hypothetical protein KSS87_009077 [Heliosperma pusillum]|nr:hypothetical protein KSS87_009077 [Heliosperma pusillum]
MYCSRSIKREILFAIVRAFDMFEDLNPNLDSGLCMVLLSSGLLHMCDFIGRSLAPSAVYELLVRGLCFLSDSQFQPSALLFVYNLACPMSKDVPKHSIFYDVGLRSKPVNFLCVKRAAEKMNLRIQTNTADMLEEAVEYVKTLQRQIQELTEQQKKCKCMPES